MPLESRSVLESNKIKIDYTTCAETLQETFSACTFNVDVIMRE